MEKEEDYREWLRKADDDIEIAMILANHHKPKVDGICFHCQQCAEKALKGFLVYHKAKLEYIHNLEKICTDCAVLDSTFLSIVKYCGFLNPYISATRYPSKVETSEPDMKIAIKYAQKILNFVKEKVTVNP